MSASVRLLRRLFWLIDTINKGQPITKEEIDRQWARASENDWGELEYERHCFTRHKNEIADLFNLDIEFDRHTNAYRFANGAEDNEGKISQMILDYFALNNVASMAAGLQDKIDFEAIPKGTQWLSTIVRAIRDKRKLEITRQSFGSDDVHSFLLSPYALKAFKQRWYIVGKSDSHPEETDPRVYALDRVSKVDATDEPAVVPKRFSVSRFFSNYMGVDRREPPQHIRVRVSRSEAYFLRSLPLHASQEEQPVAPDPAAPEGTFEHEGYSIFSYYVAPTIDFRMELFKFGSGLEVLTPASLRDDFRQQHLRALRQYG